MKDWKEIFRMFYNDNEAGGSSRWLVTPMSVEIFIEGLLMNKKMTIYEQAKRLLGEILSDKYGTKNRKILIARLHELLETLTEQAQERKEDMEKFFGEKL